MRYCRTKQSQFSIAQDGVPRCWEWLIFVAAAVVFFFLTKLLNWCWVEDLG